MVALNISLNAIQSVGRRAVELLLLSIIGVVGAFFTFAGIGFSVPLASVQPESWIGLVLCLLAGLFGAIIGGVIGTALALYDIAVEILKTPILLIISVCSWIYNSFVGFKRLFKSIGENELFVSNRYQDLDCRDLDAIEMPSIIKKLAHITVPSKPEKAQKVSSTKAAVGYTLGFYDIKSKDEVKGKKSPGLPTEYVVKPKTFPRRTGGYMIY